MKAVFIKSKRVWENYGIASIGVGYKHYKIGVEIQGWGIRIMLVFWHLCIHYK